MFDTIPGTSTASSNKQLHFPSCLSAVDEACKVDRRTLRIFCSVGTRKHTGPERNLTCLHPVVHSTQYGACKIFPHMVLCHQMFRQQGWLNFVPMTQNGGSWCLVRSHLVTFGQWRAAVNQHSHGCIDLCSKVWSGMGSQVSMNADPLKASRPRDCYLVVICGRRGSGNGERKLVEQRKMANNFDSSLFGFIAPKYNQFHQFSQ